MISRYLSLGLGLLLVSVMAHADRLELENGSVLIGTLVTADEDKVVFNTPFAGDISVQPANIKTIVTDTGVNLLLQDGSVYRDKQIVAEEDTLIAQAADQPPVRFAVQDIKLINPEPWRLGEGYNWTGRIEAALESERGNSDTDELDMSLESGWRSLVDRYTLRGNWEIDKTNGERNKYLWMLHGKYDRFSSDDPNNYYGVQLRFDHDEFEDLDLRTAVGPYIGREFYDTPALQAHAEIGFAYVDEQFDVAEDNDYWAATWELRVNSEPFWNLQLYANQDGIVDVTDVDQVIVNTVLGLRFPTLFGITSAAEAVYEYDGGAVEGVDDTDETYRLKIGYTW